MARAIWTGAVSFGLVSIPVRLFAATQEHEVRFHQFEEGTTSRIRYRRVNADTGEDVDYSEIVKGAELPDGEYVTLTDEELSEVEPKRTKAIEISDFVDLETVDPIYFQKSYFLVPTDDNAQKPYALLAAAIAKSGRAGIASFVLRNKEHLAVIRTYDGALMLNTMFFADEVRSVESVFDGRPEATTRKQDLDMAVDLIESLATDWDPTRYHDRYTERVNELIEAKSKHETFESGEEEQEAEIVDLTAALRASVERSKGRTARASSAAESTSELSELSKTELYDLAQSLKIDGRSKMNRGQLQRAISAARSGQAS